MPAEQQSSRILIEGKGFYVPEAELQAAQEVVEAAAVLAACPVCSRKLEAEGEPGHLGPLREALAAQRAEGPSDDEGLEPIETSPLTEREPDL